MLSERNENIYFRMMQLLDDAPTQEMFSTELKQRSNLKYDYTEPTLAKKLRELHSTGLVSRNDEDGLKTIQGYYYKLTDKGSELLNSKDPADAILKYVSEHKPPKKKKKRKIEQISETKSENTVTSLEVFKVPFGIPTVVITPKTNPLAHLPINHQAQLEFQRKTNKNLSLFQFFKNHTQAKTQLAWMEEQERIGKIYAEDFDHPSKAENLKKSLKIKDLVELYQRDAKRKRG